MSLLKTLVSFILILSLVQMPANSQPVSNKYDAEWKKVESLIEKGLPQSALVEVNRIYAKAKEEKQPAHIIKAIMYRSTLQRETRENNESISISEIEQEISQSQEPVTSLLRNLLAETYLDYFSANRWKFYNRTETVDFKKDDIATWTATDFHRKISELFLQSIKNEKILQATRLEPFNPIIEKGNMRHLRPTLYDVLAHGALNYFQNDERDIAKPAYAFEISQASAFDPAADFVTRKFDTKDSLSLQHKALLTWQKLIAFHLADANPAALIDADLHRIEFVRSKSTHPDKDQLYFNAINHIARQYGNLPAASQAWYLVAQYYEEKASGYAPYGDTTHRFARLKAKEICEQVLSQKDSSEGKINCLNLLNEISRANLEFEVEKVNTPGLPFRVLVSYRNFNRLYLRLIRATDELKESLANEYDEKFWPAILNAGSMRSWEQSLPVTNDMQRHRTEIAVDALPTGEYILLAGNDPDFSGKKIVMGARYFYVSSISYVNNGFDFFVLDREQGTPLANASVQTWEQHYDYKVSKYVKAKGKLYTTNSNGFFRMDSVKQDTRKYSNYSYVLDIRHKTDRLFMNDMIFAYYDYDEKPKATSKTIQYVFLFLDRGIYRPGQTVFFKGIAVNRNTGDYSNGISPGYETTVTLRDANHQVVDSIRVKTSEFGSFNGSFRLPQGGLNGQFTIAVSRNEGMTSFRVEEYKRPKFEVDYEPIKGTYQVNDTIRVTGFAKAYAGNNIDGALVKYRVIRQARFPYPWLSRGWWLPRSQPMEIAHGEVTTDKDGKFQIAFKAIPDLSIDRKFEPVFNYVITADVTDINGETRSGDKTVSAGYKSLLLKTTIPATVPADSLDKLDIRTENMNGEFEPSVVKVIITKLVPEKRLIRDRYWARPDQFVMSREEYISKFPHDEYDDERDFRNWEKGQQVFERSDSSKANGEWSIANVKFEAGFYQVEVITKDKNGQEVKTVNYTELFDEKAKELNRPDYLWNGISKTTAEPGENAKVEIGTSSPNQFIVLKTDKNKGGVNRTTDYSFVTLDNEKRIFTLPVSENDRGGYGVSWMFIRHNRVYQVNKVIEVPWTNKELEIEYASFRDKTLPGSTETWKLKISGYKKDIVAAELLAGMYDASLDQFVPHNWQAPQIWPTYRAAVSWTGNSNFIAINSVERYLGEDEMKYVDKRYDYLVWANGNNGVFTDSRIVLRGVRSMAPSAEAGNELSISSQKRETDANADKEWAISDKDGDGAEDQMDQSPAPARGDVVIRKNFNETAFFFPDLRTDSSGSIEFSFTIPDALTRWKFMALAHTKDASFGQSSKEIVTQKELMVQPNAPRFLREGDKMEFSSKIVNLSDKELTGTVEFRLFDASTNEPVDGAFRSVVANQYFTVAAGQSEAVKFPIEVPFLFNKSLLWRIVAKAGNYSDGEENVLPVLTNRMLVTETLPLHLRGYGTKNFTFDKLLNAGSSETLQHHALTIEYSSNPAWYAIQALPYLMEYPYDCAEQTWNRYYANSLASYIAGSSPKIKAVFEQWKTIDTAALLSNLQKNPELKAILLEETPWVLAAKTESEQKRNLAMLFDMVKMSEQLNSSYEKLKQMQSSNGGFVWFTGGPDDRYMTQYIVSGIGHLRKLGAVSPAQNDKLEAILTTALPYLDRKIKEQYDELVKSKTDLKKYTPGHTEIQYLYMRSFFTGYKIAAGSEKAYQYFRERAKLTWASQSKYMQGMTALALHRTGDEITPVAILKSLKETSITNEELGMYWKNQRAGWFWYEAPVETQALLIETFQEIGKDTKTVDDLRTWLLKNKQTNNWKTTKATAEACYALLLQGTDWLTDEPVVQVQLGGYEGGKKLEINSQDFSVEKGTGYFKKTIDGPDVFAGMGKIAVTVGSGDGQGSAKPGGSSWGGVYWQYFEDLDKITTAATPLQLNKKLFVERNTDRGPVITPINDGDVIKTGDKIKVRVELRVDRDMEYVHMKDMRASSLEPVNVLSSYKWQGGLGYYESTRDASTNFFFNYLRKGTYVFEYTLFATHSGNFSNGVTTIQCMYAPEFTSHSEGIRIQVE